MSYIKADDVLPQNIIKIIQQYLDGERVSVLASRYYLSDKSIQRIIREMRISESA